MATKCLNARNIFGGISITGMAASIANIGVGVYYKNPGEVVISAISTIFFAALTGASFKLIPEGALANTVTALTQTTTKLSSILGDADAANMTLDQLLTKLGQTNAATDKDVAALRAILEQVKHNLDQLSSDNTQLKGLYAQYKLLINQFIPLLNQAGVEDSDFASTVQTVSVQVQTIQSIDIELGQQAKALQPIFASQLPDLIAKGKSMLVEQGKQIALLTQQVADLKLTKGDLAAQVQQNTQLLQQIEQKRKLLAQETAALQKLTAAK